MDEFGFGEILAPVGNREMLIAAVRSGADAVYLGAKDFSARRNAENFSIDELKEAVEYCRIRNVRVYLTLNIMLRDDELSAAFNLSREAYNAGIDGIIVEDLGLARILNEKIPDLPLHASTQMSVHSPSALPILKELGFRQVVAGREMSKDELKAFCKEAERLDITVEVFVHGALCMCVSGQCLLSAFLGSRSGNRGLCAGPCRLPFKVQGGTGYDLSLKDLSLTEYIRELYGMGVRSFKIEGRMKRPEYVAAATSACKQALVKGVADEMLSETLKNVFSRQGFTSGYYNGELGREMFGIRTKEDVLAAQKVFPTLHEIYRKDVPTVPIEIKVNIENGKEISLTFTDGKNTVTVTGDVPENAIKKAITKEDVETSLTKLGSTAYFAKDIEITLDDGLFVPSGVLNSLRRDAALKLDSKRKEISHEKTVAEYIFQREIKKTDKKPKVYARFENADMIPDRLSGVDAVIFPLECNPEDVKNIKLPLIVDIPRGIVSEDVFKKRLSEFKENGFNTALCGNLAAVKIAKDSGFTVIADTGLNIANSESLKTAKKLGIKGAVISAENTLTQTENLSSDIEKGIIVYGNIPLMLTRNCPLKNGRDCKSCDKKGVITDRMNVEFPVRCRMGYSEVLNSLPIVMSDRQNEIKNVDFTVLYFTQETKKETERILSAYRNKTLPDIKYTRGLYYRGTL